MWNVGFLDNPVFDTKIPMIFRLNLTLPASWPRYSYSVPFLKRSKRSFLSFASGTKCSRLRHEGNGRNV